jgi:hypothetical protein
MPLQPGTRRIEIACDFHELDRRRPRSSNRAVFVLGVLANPTLNTTLTAASTSTHGCVMSSGLTRASNSSALTKPSLMAASRRLMWEWWAALATWAAAS